jgi:FlaA1/EpsC-like NDP-sugar epimerase
VLQAAAIAKGGEVFVLDMGQPVRIKDLAEKMIQLYAAQDGPQKVEIRYVGLRPGEKLYEELMAADESTQRTELQKIFVAKPEVVTAETMQTLLAVLHRCVEENGDMRVCLHALLPSFRSPDEVNAMAEAANQAESAEPTEASAQ